MNKHSFLLIALLAATSFKAYSADAADQASQAAADASVPSEILQKTQGMVASLCALPGVVYSDLLKEPLFQAVSGAVKTATTAVVNGASSTVSAVKSSPSELVSFVAANKYSLIGALALTFAGYKLYNMATAKKTVKKVFVKK